MTSSLVFFSAKTLEKLKNITAADKAKGEK
jgi:hypothetical protein